MPTQRLDPARTAVLIVDLQERLLPHMHNAVAVAAQAARLLDGARVLSLPVIATEQYRKGLGATVPEIAQRLGGATVVEKLRFSACVEPVLEPLRRSQVRCVLVAGIESHVCVLQTCLDLVDAGYVTAVAVDAIGSRRAWDQAAAEQRLWQAGVVPTTVESALLEMVREAGTATFKAMLPVVK